MIILMETIRASSHAFAKKDTLGSLLVHKTVITENSLTNTGNLISYETIDSKSKSHFVLQGNLVKCQILTLMKLYMYT